LRQLTDGINVNSVSHRRKPELKVGYHWANNEFKYALNKNPKPPGAWAKAYPDASFEVIHSGNYLDWIGGDFYQNP